MTHAPTGSAVVAIGAIVTGVRKKSKSIYPFRRLILINGWVTTVTTAPTEPALVTVGAIVTTTRD